MAARGRWWMARTARRSVAALASVTARPTGFSLRCGAALLALGLATTPAVAAPADDHARGLLAYQRGDVVAAMAALRPAAKAGHTPSQALLAHILDRADFPEEAATLYRQAADSGDAEGHAGLANLLLIGRGIAKDEKRAREHFSKAAELGHVLATQVIADAHLKGQMGLTLPSSDPAQAVVALKRAAEQGHLPAIDALALAYRRGDYGLAADATQAATMQARAAELRRQRAAAPTKGKS
jgi:TPR repeat protein